MKNISRELVVGGIFSLGVPVAGLLERYLEGFRLSRTKGGGRETAPSRR